MTTPTTIDACWNRIGVRGDRSCPELNVHVHCRNCPTYSGAARIRLDAPAPPEAATEWTQHFAQPRQSDAEAGLRSALIFRIGAEWLAIATLACLEVAGIRPLHLLPHRRNAAVLGVANLRGELRVCVSLGKLLNLASSSDAPAKAASRSSHEKERLVVVGLESGPVVFPVDEVLGVRRYRDADIHAVPATVSKASVRYTSGLLSLESRSVGLLDAGLLSGALSEVFA